MNTLIYDIEIVKAIPGKDLIDGIQYCQGWRDFEGMGISVIGWQWNTEEPRHVASATAFLDILMQHEDEDYVLCGFNSAGFDDKLLEANGLEGISTHYDLLIEVRAAAGHDSYTSVPKEHTYKLDAIAKANGMAKTGTGELAPILWQQGKHLEVIDYCLHDVQITKALLDLGLAGQLVDPNTGDLLQLAPLRDRITDGGG